MHHHLLVYFKKATRALLLDSEFANKCCHLHFMHRTVPIKFCLRFPEKLKLCKNMENKIGIFGIGKSWKSKDIKSYFWLVGVSKKNRNQICWGAISSAPSLELRTLYGEKEFHSLFFLLLNLSNSTLFETQKRKTSER